jgi:hypothetical protein
MEEEGRDKVFQFDCIQGDCRKCSSQPLGLRKVWIKKKGKTKFLKKDFHE